MRLGRIAWTLLAALIAGWLGTIQAWAQIELAYTANGVAVDQTAATAAQARDAAMLAGQRAGLRQVFERVTPRAELRRLPQVSAAKLADLVASLEVEDERASATRYLGRLTVRFKPDGVRDLLRNAGLSVAETMSRPVVVLPILQIAGKPVLWGEGNPWRDAWAAIPRPTGLTPMIVPRDDADDAAAIAAEGALAGDPQAVARIARLYDAGGVLVALARADRPTQPLRIELTRIGVEGNPLTAIESFARRAREEDAAFFRRAALAVVEQVEESWKSDVLPQLSREGRLVAYAPIQDLRQWVALRTQLGTVAAVRKSDLVSMSRNEAVVEITFSGDEAQLRLALAQRNIVLAEEGGRWRLQGGAP